MAQSGYTPIAIYSSSTATNVPLAANLVAGELAINIVDGKLYYKNSSGVVTLLANTSTVSPVTTFSGGTTGLTPSSATSGAITLAGTLAIANGGTGLSSFTANQIHYGSFLQSASLTWNGTTLAVTGAITASADSAFNGTGALQLPVGTTAQQPTGAIGKLRFNSTTSQFEGYTGSAWSSVGGSAVSNDTTTATNLYPLFATATTGTAQNIYTSNAKYLYTPSTGDLQASQLIASNGIISNNSTVATSYTITTGNNSMSVGPITVATGQSVTVSSGSRWVIL